MRKLAFYTVLCWINDTSTEITLSQFETFVLHSVPAGNQPMGSTEKYHHQLIVSLEQLVLTHELLGEPRQDALFREFAHGLDALECGDDDLHLLQLFAFE